MHKILNGDIDIKAKYSEIHITRVRMNIGTKTRILFSIIVGGQNKKSIYFTFICAILFRTFRLF